MRQLRFAPPELRDFHEEKWADRIDAVLDVLNPCAEDLYFLLCPDDAREHGFIRD